jgi:hypothetical protein
MAKCGKLVEKIQPPTCGKSIVCEPHIPMKATNLTHQEIAQQAYQIYVRSGCKHGHAEEHWLQAEAELRSMMSESTPEAGKASGNGSSKSTPKAAAAAAPTATAPAKSPAAASATQAPPKVKKTPKAGK